MIPFAIAWDIPGGMAVLAAQRSAFAELVRQFALEDPEQVFFDARTMRLVFVATMARRARCRLDAMDRRIARLISPLIEGRRRRLFRPRIVRCFANPRTSGRCRRGRL